MKKPDLNNKVSLMNALQQRKSTRSFSNKPINKQDLSNLLWTAGGINRKKVAKQFHCLVTSETAYKLGFEYPKYFSRLFKKKVEMSPKAYIESSLLN